MYNYLSGFSKIQSFLKEDNVPPPSIDITAKLYGDECNKFQAMIFLSRLCDKMLLFLIVIILCKIALCLLAIVFHRRCYFPHFTSTRKFELVLTEDNTKITKNTVIIPRRGDLLRKSLYSVRIQEYGPEITPYLDTFHAVNTKVK